MFIFNPNSQNNGVNIFNNENSDYSVEETESLADENKTLKMENFKLKEEKELLTYLKKSYETKIESLQKIIIEHEIKIKKINDKLNFFVDAYYDVANEKNEKIDLLKNLKNDYTKNIAIKEKEILNLTKLLKEKEKELNKLKQQNENLYIKFN